jgi:hypothetical protein
MATNNEWGVFPELTRLLIKYTRQQPDLVPSFPSQRNGVWDVYTQHLGAMWGRAYRPVVDVPFPFEYFARRSFVRSLLRQRYDQKEFHQQLKVLLVQAHAWLLQRSANWLGMGLTRHVPLSFARVSQKGIACTLYAYALSDKYLRRILPPFASCGPQSLDADAECGDLIVQHLNIEHLMDVVQKTLSLRLLPLGEKSACGGLRTGKFLQVYAALQRRSRNDQARWWLERIHELVQHSPLTNLIYADVLDPPVPLRSEVFLPLITNRDAFWQGQLTRSLLGMSISPVPAFAGLQSLREEIRKLERRLDAIPHEGWRSRLKRWHIQRRCQRVQADLQTSQIVVARQYASRFQLLADVFAVSTDPSENVPVDPAHTKLQVAFLDMFVRYIVMVSAGDMQSEWPRIQKTLYLPTDPARFHLFQRNCKTYSSVVELLFHQEQAELREIWGICPAEVRMTTRTMLTRIMQPDLELITDTEIYKQFNDEAIELPFEPPNHEGDAPRVVLHRYWLDNLLDLIPGVQAEIEEEQHVEMATVYR